jgi:hypothetical protein
LEIIMADKNDEIIRKRRDHHVIFCTTAIHAVKGTQAEHDTLEYLLKHLDKNIVGDYRLLVNYNIVERDQDGKMGNSLEVDVVVINRRGVFLLEVKDWRGTIKPHDDVWVFKSYRGKEEERKNALNLINHKARVLHTQLFSRSGDFSDLDQTSVIGLVVLTQGVQLYIPNAQCHDNRDRIVDLHNPLLEALSTHSQLHKRFASMPLNDPQIQAISRALFDAHVPPEVIVHGYRIERELSEGDLYSVAFEAQHTQVASRRVRLKRYQLFSLSESRVESDLLKFQRSIQALSDLENERANLNILRTQDFFADDLHNPDVFYEVTELPTGPSLADAMEMSAQQGRKMSPSRQLSFLEPVGKALQYAHNHKDARGRSAPIYHRNVCPETVFQMRDGTVKLGDFDFAKLMEGPTLTEPGKVLLEKPYTAPELLDFPPTPATASSDIYALGVLWYFMACLPQEPSKFEPTRIDVLDLPQEARTLIKRMTAQKMFERPQKIEEVLEEMARIKGRAK